MVRDQTLTPVQLVLVPDGRQRGGSYGCYVRSANVRRKARSGHRVWASELASLLAGGICRIYTYLYLNYSGCKYYTCSSYFSSYRNFSSHLKLKKRKENTHNESLYLTEELFAFSLVLHKDSSVNWMLARLSSTMWTTRGHKFHRVLLRPVSFPGIESLLKHFISTTVCYG